MFLYGPSYYVYTAEIPSSCVSTRQTGVGEKGAKVNTGDKRFILEKE